MDLSIILLFPTSFICGLSYYPADKDFLHHEINIYLFLLQFQIRWYEQDNSMV